MTTPTPKMQGNTEGYTRRFVDDTMLLIEAVCDQCGFRIVGSAAQHLADDEREHREKCAIRAGRLLAKTSRRPR